MKEMNFSYSDVIHRNPTRVVHGSDGPAGRVGSGRVTILPVFGGSDRVGSALRILKFFTGYFLIPDPI